MPQLRDALWLDFHNGLSVGFWVGETNSYSCTCTSAILCHRVGCTILPYLSQKVFGRAEHLSNGFAQICHLGREGSRTDPDTTRPKRQNAGRLQALVTSWVKSKSKSASTVRHYVGHFAPRWKQAQLLQFHSHGLTFFSHCKDSPTLWNLAEEKGAPSSIALLCHVFSMFKIPCFLVFPHSCQVTCASDNYHSVRFIFPLFYTHSAGSLWNTAKSVKMLDLITLMSS